MSKAMLPRYVLGSLLLAVLVMAYRLLAMSQASHLSDAGSLVSLATVTCLFSLLLLPIAQNPLQLFTNGLLATAAFLLFGLLTTSGPLPLLIILQGGLAVFSICLLLHGLVGLLQRFGPTTGFAAPMILLIALFAGSSTIWLGPAVELWMLENRATDLIIAGSPLSYLSVAFEYDYLRNEWFYQHSPFGSLRFSYPEFAGFTAVYLGLAIGLQGLIHLFKPNDHQLSSD